MHWACSVGDDWVEPQFPHLWWQLPTEVWASQTCEYGAQYLQDVVFIPPKLKTPTTFGPPGALWSYVWR